MNGTKNDLKKKEEKPRVVIGTLGQESHGKTTLTTAIFLTMEQDHPTEQKNKSFRISNIIEY